MDISVKENIPAVAQITKQGLTFVFDRRTGEPVWPIEEVAVPQSDVPGEQTAATTYTYLARAVRPDGRHGRSTERPDA